MLCCFIKTAIDLCNDIIDNILTNLLRYLDPQDSWANDACADSVYQAVFLN